jgi:hypothetical protein
MWMTALLPLWFDVDDWPEYALILAVLIVLIEGVTHI